MKLNLNHQRKVWLRIHLVLALALGLFFALIGLAGSLSVYGESLDEWLNSDLAIVESQGEFQSLDRIVASVRARHPDRQGGWILEMPRSNGSPLTAWYENPCETAGSLYAPLMVAVNPYTAEVLSSRFWGRTAITWVLDLHTQLHWGRWGWNLVGCLGIGLLISVLSGLYLWWPGLAGLRDAFVIRHDRGAFRLALDLHRSLGLASSIMLLVLAFTGANLAFPRVSETLLGASGMSHDDEGPTVRSSAMPNNRPVSLDEAVLLARGPFPHAEVRRVATPNGPTGTYRVSLRQRFEASRRHPVTTVWVDQYSGQIREVRNPARFSSGETALTWLWPLHTGEALGPWGRLLWFFAGLSPAVLYVTGLLRRLIGRGSLRDFAVDLPRLKRNVERLFEAAVDAGMNGYRRLRPVLIEAGVRVRRLAAMGKGLVREQAGKRARR
jgi:uncharacterized iron-regulated membrane protein